MKSLHKSYSIIGRPSCYSYLRTVKVISVISGVMNTLSCNHLIGLEYYIIDLVKNISCSVCVVNSLSIFVSLSYWDKS